MLQTITDELLTVAHAARALGASEGTIRRLANLGALPCLRTSSGERLFRPADVAGVRALRAQRGRYELRDRRL